MSPLLKGLTEERIVLLKPTQASRLPFALNKGVVRLVDGKGNTLGLLLDRETLEELEEEVEASDPAFLSALEESRASGRVSGEVVKKKLGIK